MSQDLIWWWDEYFFIFLIWMFSLQILWQCIVCLEILFTYYNRLKTKLQQRWSTIRQLTRKTLFCHDITNKTIAPRHLWVGAKEVPSNDDELMINWKLIEEKNISKWKSNNYSSKIIYFLTPCPLKTYQKNLNIQNFSEM